MADADPIDTRLVRKLAAILSETGLTEIEVERGDLKIRVARQTTAPAVSAPPPVAAPAAPAAPEAAASSTEALPPGEVVKSPMVGTVYLQPQPDAEPFAKVGERVNLGQTVLIVEAMKTMNPIAAPKAGMLRAVLVTDGQPVEYGQPLAVIE